jgi:predicted transposase/invertase (TIGR01784 family)
MDLLSKWIIFMKYADDDSKKDLIEALMIQEEAINMAADTLRQLSQDEKERIKYEDRQKWLLDIESSKEYVRRKSRKEGLEEGRNEIIKNLLNLGSDISFIAKATGLKEDEILKIIDEINL